VSRYIAASLIIAALALYIAGILFKALATGVLSIQKGSWLRAKEPGAYWYNIVVVAVFLLVPVIIAALAAFTFVR
jgi:hypothetical protein